MQTSGIEPKEIKFFKFLMINLLFFFRFSTDFISNPVSWITPTSIPYMPLDERDYQRTPLELEINVENLRTGADNYQCSEVDQNITWNGYKYRCKEEDIITNEKMDALQETVINLKNYFSKLVRVKKSDSIPFSTINSSMYQNLFPKTGNLTASNYIVLISRPFDSPDKIQSANILYNKYGRPIVSVINIKAKYLATLPQDIKTDQRSTFLLLFHEIIHCLGYRSNEINLWIDKSTGKRYNPVPIYNYTIPNTTKNYIFLCTHLAKQVAQNRTQLKQWYDKEMCLQLDDNDIHIKGSVYALDVMANPNSPKSFITDASLAVIEDMGWYTVDFSYSECSTWSNQVFDNYSWIDNLSLNPPAEFPKELFFDALDVEYPSYDYRGYLNTSNAGISRINMTHLDKYYQMNTSIYGKYDFYDFAPFLISEVDCTPDWAILLTYPNQTQTSFCAPLVYNETHVNIFLESNISCETGTVYNGGNVTCPPLKLINKVLACENSKGSEYSHLALPAEKKGHSLTVWFLIIGFIAFLALVGAAGAIWKYYNYIHNQPDPHDEFKKMNGSDVDYATGPVTEPIDAVDSDNDL